jgi:hypothetical protein
MIRLTALITAYALTPLAVAAELDIVGTYSLVSSERVIVATGETEESYGSKPNGSITYGSDGRMMVLIVRTDRFKPESLEHMSDQQRADLFRSMLAYSGTYEIHGDLIEHHIDASWNEVWTGTTQRRHVAKDGDRLIYTTDPAPFPRDGKISVN